MAITEQRKREQRWREIHVMFAIGYIIGGWYSLHLGEVYGQYPAFTIFELDKLLQTAVMHCRSKPFFLPEAASMSLRFFYGFSIVYFALYVWYLTSRRKTMKGKEHGSARWGSRAEAASLRDRVKKKNLILTQTEQLSLDTRRTRKNLNVLVIGDSGSGKSRFYVKPNILQMHSSYVVTDLKGELLRDTGKLLEDHGYTVKILNLIDMEHSHCYSPFAYLRKDEDVLRLITCLIRNTTPPNAGTNDPFWEKAETVLLEALMYFVWYRLPVEEQNFHSIMRLLNLVSVDEENSSSKSQLDLLFDQLRTEIPGHIAVAQYDVFKQAAGKTAKSIVISAAARLAAFNIESVVRITQQDTRHLEELYANDHTVLFVMLPAGDTTFNFLASMLYTQLFQLLQTAAFESQEGRLPHHVRFLLDEFANIGTIPDFDTMISVMRSMEFSVSIILQNVEQLEKRYKDAAKTIMANCNSKLFLGGEEQTTTKMISEMLGKETIDTQTYNLTRGRQRSMSRNDQIQGRELLLPDEAARIADTDCVLMIRGMHPFYSHKFDIKKHPHYKEMYDAKDMPDHYFDYQTVVTPERVKQALPPSTPKQLPVSRMPRLQDLRIGITAIEQLRYALEYEF